MNVKVKFCLGGLGLLCCCCCFCWLLLLLPIDTQTSCCVHLINALLHEYINSIADLGRWNWGRWRVSE